MADFTIETTRVFNAPIDIVWEVVSDAGGYHRVVDTLRHTEITSGDGLGMVRHCIDTKGREWNEACTLWEPGKRMRMTVDVASYPSAFRAIFERVVGTWSVEELADGVHLSMRFDGATKLGPIGKAAVVAMGRKSVLGSIMDGYETQIRARLATDS
ncbi:MAG: SRPBCC family protein [Acidobacteria bacterium]|nr:SRPBCC family protein [Acidobacteriota bacterium]